MLWLLHRIQHGPKIFKRKPLILIDFELRKKTSLHLQDWLFPSKTLSNFSKKWKTKGLKKFDFLLFTLTLPIQKIQDFLSHHNTQTQFSSYLQKWILPSQNVSRTLNLTWNEWIEKQFSSIQASVTFFPQKLQKSASMLVDVVIQLQTSQKFKTWLLPSKSRKNSVYVQAYEKRLFTLIVASKSLESESSELPNIILPIDWPRKWDPFFFLTTDLAFSFKVSIRNIQNMAHHLFKKLPIKFSASETWLSKESRKCYFFRELNNKTHLSLQLQALSHPSRFQS